MNRIFGHDRDGSFPARPGLAVLFSWFVLTGSAAAEQGKEGWNVAETDHYTIHLQQTGSDRKSVIQNQLYLREMKVKMELIFRQYAAAFKFKGKLPRKAVLRLYRNKKAEHGLW